jgi:putative transposase
MARPYSVDLRERVVAAVVEGGLSRRQAAVHFDVATSTVIRWVRQFHDTGSVAPGKIGGHKPKTITGAHHDWMVARCRDREFTLRGLVAELAERGCRVDYRSVWNFVHAEKLSFKKNRSGQRTRPARRGAAAGAVAGISGPHRS